MLVYADSVDADVGVGVGGGGDDVDGACSDACGGAADLFGGGVGDGNGFAMVITMFVRGVFLWVHRLWAVLRLLVRIVVW